MNKVILVVFLLFSQNFDIRHIKFYFFFILITNKQVQWNKLNHYKI